MTEGLEASRWFPLGRRAPDENRTTVFCLPHAGGAAFRFYRWARATAYPLLEFVPIELPGRSSRISEPPITDVDELLDALILELFHRPIGRYALLGHSMGALLAYELVGRAVAAGRPEPSCLVVSGCQPPDFPRTADLNVLDDRLLVERLSLLGGIPVQVATDPQLLELVLPALRADLGLFVHREPAVHRLPAPIVVLSGESDPLADPRSMSGWQRFTTGGFSARAFVGGHFYLHEDPNAIMKELDHIMGAFDAGR
jgi:surfactin synthase thioesterase subunit